MASADVTVELKVDSVGFTKHLPKFLTTYRRADGEPICGEYAFVTELEWFDGDDEQTELIREHWILAAEATVWAPELSPVDEDES